MNGAKYNNKIFVIGVCAAVAVIIALIVCIWTFSGKTEKPIETSNIENTENITLIDTESIINNVNKESNIRVVSNKNNEQADIMLATVGVDIRDLLSYSASIDTTHESGHAICVLRPKESEYEKVKLGIIDYVATKQRVLQDNGKIETEEYKAAESAVINEKDGYLILVLETDSESIMNNIVDELDKMLIDNKE